MFHSLAAGFISAALAAASFIPFLGDIHHNVGTTTASTTFSGGEHDWQRNGTTTIDTNFRHGSGVSTTTIACVGTAVNSREQSIDSAVTAYNGATGSAYTARASALSAAYGNTTLDAVRSAVRSAWFAFTNATRTAQKTWRTSQQTAWSQFRTAVRACGDGATSLADQSGMGLEMRGD